MYCRIRGTPRATNPALAAKKRELAFESTNHRLQSEIARQRDENRRLRKERLKEEETLLLIDADERGTLPSLKRLRDALIETSLTDDEEDKQSTAPPTWQKRKLLDTFGDSIRCAFYF